MRLSAGRVILIIIALFVGAVYVFRRESFMGVVALASCISIPVLIIMRAVRSGRGPAPSSGGRRSRSRDFDAEEWSAGNRHENDQGEY